MSSLQQLRIASRRQLAASQRQFAVASRRSYSAPAGPTGAPPGAAPGAPGNMPGSSPDPKGTGNSMVLIGGAVAVIGVAAFYLMNSKPAKGTNPQVHSEKNIKPLSDLQHIKIQSMAGISEHGYNSTLHDLITATEAQLAGWKAPDFVLRRAEAVKDGMDPSNAQPVYNKSTGEFNWDAPALGGMAQGECGDKFRRSYECFVKSDAPIKGQDCGTQFRELRDCLQRHPGGYA